MKEGDVASSNHCNTKGSKQKVCTKHFLRLFDGVVSSISRVGTITIPRNLSDSTCAIYPRPLRDEPT
jgi:hypothetical protein